MNEIIRWLSTIEERTISAYSRAVDRFGSEKPFSNFLASLCDDGQEHLDVINRYYKLSGKGSGIVKLDPSFVEGVEGALGAIEKALSDAALTKDEFIRLVVDKDKIEWDLRLLIVTYLKGVHRDFIPFAVAVQKHKNRTQAFLASNRAYGDLYDALNALPDIFRSRILIVDDEEMIATAVERIVGNLGDVDRVGSGEKALKLMGACYYSVVISDIWMPGMSGMELYESASRVFPNLKKRFVFMSSATDTSVKEFLTANDLRFLEKPSSIAQIRSTVLEILGV